LIKRASTVFIAQIHNYGATEKPSNREVLFLRLLVSPEWNWNQGSKYRSKKNCEQIANSQSKKIAKAKRKRTRFKNCEAKAKRSRLSFVRSEAKRSEANSLRFAIFRNRANSHCEFGALLE
jgi:hypothetical protein